MKKNLLILSIFILWILNTGNLNAQNYGEDPDNCRIHLSTYDEFFKQKNYDDAYVSWSWCFHNCPEATRNIYVHGATLMEYFISKETDAERKSAYIDTLMLVYDNRIKYYNQEANVLGRKAVSMLKYRPEATEENYGILKKSFELGGNESEYYVLDFYMSMAAVMYNNEKIEKEDVIRIFEEVTAVGNYQLQNSPKTPDRIKDALAKIEEVFVNTGVADCEAIMKVYGPKFEETPDDIELAKKIVGFIDLSKSDSCKLTDLYLNAAEKVYAVEKTSRAAHSLAQAYLKRNEAANSEKFYNEAISLEEEPLKKADMYYELGLLYYSITNDYIKTRTSARNAIANNPNHGKAYMLVGRAYAAGGKNCGETPLERKILNCLIVDQFVKARNADSNVAAEANDLIGRYSASFPTQEEIFWQNMEVGQAYTIGCWINETTTIRVKAE